MLKRIYRNPDLEQGHILKDIPFTIFSKKPLLLPGICLTPACDLVIQDNGIRKADYVLLSPLFDDEVFFKKFVVEKWGIDIETGALSKKRRDSLRNTISQILSDNNIRYYRIDIPYSGKGGWIVDFQLVQAFDYDVANSFEKKYKMQSSYKERIASKYGAYMGRIGTKNIDENRILDRLISIFSPCE
ncbi:MAG: hypothetical protein XD93_0744 [candidate division WS6 bacterium 34_10]|uniref:Uncharacterized protein n=1 Tax=candidate division WS6 bacterium 34_10 TaxID=1641389 RepID=A0A101HHC9_9BACT|nr:MAG: hypothetical protein XD93_0744 [candidate division WS6 bacterium 34_10]